jgi:hypothetical protein
MDAQRPLLLLLGAIRRRALDSCANVVGLTLNRSLGVRQLMTESLLLALTGGLLGGLLGEASLSLAKHFGPDSIPHLHDVGLDLRVMV